MAGIKCVANPGEITSGVAAKTILQITAPTNQRLLIKKWGVFCKGIASTDSPIKVRLLRQTTAGTMTAHTPIALGLLTETIQTTAEHTASAEPTAGSVLAQREVHPQSGYYEIFPFGEEIIVPGAGRLGIEVTATVSISVIPEIVFEG